VQLKNILTVNVFTVEYNMNLINSLLTMCVLVQMEDRHLQETSSLLAGHATRLKEAITGSRG